MPDVRSRTRGQRTATGPMLVMISRSGRWPWRTRRRRPSSPTSSACRSSKSCHGPPAREAHAPHCATPHSRGERARMTVLADHRAPLGVSTWRAFNSARHGPTCLSIPRESAQWPVLALGPSAWRVSLIAGSRGPPSLTPRALAAARPAQRPARELVRVERPPVRAVRLR